METGREGMGEAWQRRWPRCGVRAQGFWSSSSQMLSGEGPVGWPPPDPPPPGCGRSVRGPAVFDWRAGHTTCTLPHEFHGALRGCPLFRGPVP